MLDKFEIYENGYQQNHSIFLNNHFTLSCLGVDYYNPYNVGFEFKETFGYKNVFFKIPKEQLEQSDYLVLNFYNENFYIHNSKYFLKRFKFKNGNCYLRPNTAKKNYIFKTDDILKLVDYIENKIE